jgi:hypothetical protein
MPSCLSWLGFRAIQHDDTVWGARLRKNENRIVSRSSDKTLRLWDAATGKQSSLATHPMTRSGEKGREPHPVLVSEDVAPVGQPLARG